MNFMLISFVQQGHSIILLHITKQNALRYIAGETFGDIVQYINSDIESTFDYLCKNDRIINTYSEIKLSWNYWWRIENNMLNYICLYTECIVKNGP